MWSHVYLAVATKCLTPRSSHTTVEGLQVDSLRGSIEAFLEVQQSSTASRCTTTLSLDTRLTWVAARAVGVAARWPAPQVRDWLSLTTLSRGGILRSLRRYHTASPSRRPT